MDQLVHCSEVHHILECRQVMLVLMCFSGMQVSLRSVHHSVINHIPVFMMMIVTYIVMAILVVLVIEHFIVPMELMVVKIYDFQIARSRSVETAFQRFVVESGFLVGIMHAFDCRNIAARHDLKKIVAGLTGGEDQAPCN